MSLSSLESELVRRVTPNVYATLIRFLVGFFNKYISVLKIYWVDLAWLTLRCLKLQRAFGHIILAFSSYPSSRPQRCPVLYCTVLYTHHAMCNPNSVLWDIYSVEPAANCCPDELVLLNCTVCCTALLLVLLQLNVKYQTNRCGSSKVRRDVI